MAAEAVQLHHPQMLWLLAAVLPYALFRMRSRRRASIAFAPLQYALGPRRRRLVGASAPLLESVLLAVVVLAIAGPYRSHSVRTLGEEGLDLVLALDISASMQAADFPPNRLEALKELAKELLLRGSSNRVAVYAFAGHTFTQTPLTTDHRSLLDLVDGLAYESINHSESGGTALGDALLVATDTLIGNRIEDRDQVVVMITDGESNKGADPMLAANFLRENHIRLHVIGVGGHEPIEVYVNGEPFINSEDEHLVTSLDDAQLEQIAATAGGRYRRAENLDVLRAIFDELSRLEQTPLERGKTIVEVSLVPQISLLLALCFALWMIVDGVVLRRPLR